MNTKFLSIHALPNDATVCENHPDAKTCTDGGIRICLATFHEHLKATDAPAVAAASEDKPKKEEEPVFKTPQQILAEKEEKLRRERSYYVKSCEDALAMGIKNMVTDGKTECIVAFSATRLTRDEYAEIAKKLRASGYLVIFVDKKTGVSILDSQPAASAAVAAGTGPRCQCGCSSEVGGVLREMAHIRDALTGWASSFLAQEKTHNWNKDEILIEARISIALPACEQQQGAKGGEEQVPLFSVPQQQQHHISSPEEGRGPVMQLLMTTPVTHILLAFFVLPMFLPRFLVGIWQLFMGFILVSRFLRWNSHPIPVSRGQTNERCSSAQTVSGFIPGVYAAQGC